MGATATAIRTIPVELSSHPYPVLIGTGALENLGEQIRNQGIKAGTKLLVVTNPVVNEHYGTTALSSLEAAGFNTSLLVIEAGEDQKTPATVAQNPNSFTTAPISVLL